MLELCYSQHILTKTQMFKRDRLLFKPMRKKLLRFLRNLEVWEREGLVTAEDDETYSGPFVAM